MVRVFSYEAASVYEYAYLYLYTYGNSEDFLLFRLQVLS